MSQADDPQTEGLAATQKGYEESREGNRIKIRQQSVGHLVEHAAQTIA
jgi:hypothetical protein